MMLDEHKGVGHIGLHAVGKGKVDDPPIAEWYRRLCSIPRQGLQPFTTAASKYEYDDVFHTREMPRVLKNSREYSAGFREFTV
jgi:hypothetical protein